MPAPPLQNSSDCPESADRRALYRAGAVLLALLLVTLVFHQEFADRMHRAVREFLHIALAAGLAFAYLRGYRAVQAGADASRTIVGFGVAFVLVALFIKPFHSLDIYNYINTGWLQTQYGLDPYVAVPADIPDWQQDPMFHAEWSHTHTVYGFLFTTICRLVCRAGQGNLSSTLLLFKAMNAIAFAWTAWVVWLGSRRLQQARPERSLYLFLWNPLLLLHVIGNGHNDLLMGLMTVASIYLAMRGDWLLVLPVLVAGALVKFGSAVLLPFAFLYLVKRHGWTKAGLSAAAAILIGVAMTAPWVTIDEGISAWGRLATNTTAIHDSLPAMVFFPCEVVAKRLPALVPYEDAVIATIKLTFWAGFLVLLARVAWLRVRALPYQHETFVRDCLLLQFVLVCVVSSKYYVWYLGMFFPLALWVVSDDWLQRATLAMSCAQLLALTFISQSHGLNELLMLLTPLAWALWPSLLPREADIPVGQIVTSKHARLPSAHIVS